MLPEFCTKIGYPKKAARLFAKICFVLMTLTCGLFGLFEKGDAPDYPNAGSRAMHMGARAGVFSPAIFSIRR